jgi:hypothetical protein
MAGLGESAFYSGAYLDVYPDLGQFGDDGLQ